LGHNPASAYVALCFLVSLVVACQPKEQVSQQGTPVAQYGEAILTAESLAFLIPSELSKADSQVQAKKYIDNWLKKQALLDAGSAAIPSLQKKLEAEAEVHRLSLASYYYGEFLAESAMQKAVSANEVANYYNKHEGKFIPEDNYYAFFYVKSNRRLPNQQVALMRSDDAGDINELRSWAGREKATYRLDSSWSAEPVLAGILEGSYLKPRNLRLYRTQTFRTNNNGEESHYAVKLIAKVKQGERLPLGFCRDQITEIILTQRKKQFLSQEASKLLQKAQNEGKAKRF
jgi:hypothetical protein